MVGKKICEERATIRSLVTDNFAPAYHSVMYLAVMFIEIKQRRHKLLQCAPPPISRLGDVSTYMCEYTKVYVDLFPELALVVVIYLLSRNLLQKRLYYDLLRN